MEKSAWMKGFPGAITVCDKEGIIIYMNDRSLKAFSDEGGERLLGTNLLECHPEPAKSKLIEMLKNPVVNSYTIEKKGIKKLIYQTPWYEDGTYMGFVELSLEIPFEMPHFVRK